MRKASLVFKRSSKQVWIGSLVLFLSGCAVTADGIGPARRPPDANKVAQVESQLRQNAAAADVQPLADGDGAPLIPGIVVVGTTGPLRTILDKDRAGFYAAYLKEAEQWHPGVPTTMSAEEFETTLAGWASIQIAGIPGVANIRLRMLVPATVAHDTRFASAAGSFMFGTTGDLVVARTDRDGLLWLDHVLCPDDGLYHSCARDYQKGVFDQNTGQALDRDRKPKSKGAIVDLTSYKIKRKSGS